jgi:hypothetical protein
MIGLGTNAVQPSAANCDHDSGAGITPEDWMTQSGHY